MRGLSWPAWYRDKGLRRTGQQQISRRTLTAKTNQPNGAESWLGTVFFFGSAFSQLAFFELTVGFGISYFPQRSFHSEIRLQQFMESRAPTKGDATRSHGVPNRPTFWCLCICIAVITGCQGSGWLHARRSPASPLVDALKLKSWSGPQPTPRTMQWLRRYDLVKAFEDQSPQEFVDSVSQVVADHPVRPGCRRRHYVK